MVNRGLLGRQSGDINGAISDYTKAIQLQPTGKRISSIYANPGISKIQLKDVKGALADWRKALSLGERRASKWIRSFC